MLEKLKEVGMGSEWKEYRLEKSECTGVPKINLSYLKNFSVSLPQPRIASILTALDDKIELNRRIPSSNPDQFPTEKERGRLLK